MFSLSCVWINVWVNNREVGDLRHYRSHYDVTGIVQSYPIAGSTTLPFMNGLYHSSGVTIRSKSPIFAINTLRSEHNWSSARQIYISVHFVIFFSFVMSLPNNNQCWKHDNQPVLHLQHLCRCQRHQHCFETAPLIRNLLTMVFIFVIRVETPSLPYIN